MNTKKSFRYKTIPTFTEASSETKVPKKQLPFQHLSWPVQQLPGQSVESKPMGFLWRRSWGRGCSFLFPAFKLPTRSYNILWAYEYNSLWPWLHMQALDKRKSKEQQGTARHFLSLNHLWRWVSQSLHMDFVCLLWPWNTSWEKTRLRQPFVQTCCWKKLNIKKLKARQIGWLATHGPSLELGVSFYTIPLPIFFPPVLQPPRWTHPASIGHSKTWWV